MRVRQIVISNGSKSLQCEHVTCHAVNHDVAASSCRKNNNIQVSVVINSVSRVMTRAAGFTAAWTKQMDDYALLPKSCGERVKVT